MQPFTIHIHISPDDFRSIALHRIFRRPVTIVLMALAFLCILLNVLAFFGIIDGAVSAEIPLIYLLFPVVVVGLALFRAMASYKSSARLREGIDYTFSEEEVRAKAADSEWAYKWSAVQRSAEMKKYFLIYVTKTSAEILLKEKLTAEQMEFIRIKASKYSI
jgi:hypothetical protein